MILVSALEGFATALTQASVGQQDAVVFNHPHLGLADLQETVGHARRHGDQQSTLRLTA